MKNEELSSLLSQINFCKNYENLCNNFNDSNNRITITKNEFTEKLNEVFFNLKYEKRDKTFYNDYKSSGFSIRLSITFSIGFIECFYVLFDELDQTRITGRFNTFSSIEDINFNTRVNNKFPIVSSLNDLLYVLSSIKQLHEEFIDCLFSYGLKKRKIE